MAELSLEVQTLIVSDRQRELDLAMVPYDLWGTRAHVLMLEKQQIVDRAKARAILIALNQIEKEWNDQQFEIDPQRGAQLTLEKKIVELAGEQAGLSTHTARSRNDQVMVTETLYIRDRLVQLWHDA
ncbi:MAG: hypothetical protein KDD53_11075, partial [Bdellovibrionales bacterium]|nr:hypothetical protein [Bdellovibrionales bacterium]